jgi:hypothetical protein
MTRTAAAILLYFSLGVAAGCFCGIVRRYRTVLGFPWLLSVTFAAAAILAILAVHFLMRA